MADSQTPNFNLVKPEISGSPDTWGGKLNDNFDKIDTALQDVTDATDAQQAGGGTAAEVQVEAAATTGVLNVESVYVRVNGATTISSFGNGVGSQNKLRVVRFLTAGAVIKNNAVIQTTGGSDITTEVGDIAVLESSDATPPIVRMVSYTRASGEPVKFADRGKFLTLPEVVYTADATLTNAEAGKALIANRVTAITFNLPAVSAAGTVPYIIKNINDGLLTLDPNGTETIEGTANLSVEKGATMLMWPTVGGWRAFLLHAKATVDEFRKGVADRWLDPKTVQDAMKWVTLAYSSSMAVDHQLGCYRKVLLTASAAIQDPSNPIENYPLEFWLQQSGSGNNAITWGPAYDFGDFGAPTLSTVSGQADAVSFTCLSVSPLKYQFRGIRRRVD